MELKTYQRDTLDALREFLETARLIGPQAAYDGIVRQPARAERLARLAGRYRPLDGLPGTPYVCLRLPTGGGKTILGAHSVKVVADAWAEKEFPVVLWLVPTNTIRTQTVDALRNPRHPYRRALDAGFGGHVRVFDIADFDQMLAHDIGARLCVVVGTIQTLRVDKTEGRRVYAHSEALETHFTRIPPTTPGLEPREDGKGPKFSFANLLHVHRPIMIVDEAHNAVTGLTREMQQRVNPCAIVEFTATPRSARSNILHNVTAQELKAADMVKLPIRLAEHRTWQAAVSDAITRRAALAETAKNEREYIRPITLFQAQPKNQEVTVEALRQHLIEVERVPESRIAVATGDQRGLDGIDLFDPACPIEHVITVEALKEGWDCSFAYVFCSVANVRSATDVEQLLGRVLRMPYAIRRQATALNEAYACVPATGFQEAARALTDKLVDMGFEEEEAAENVLPAQGDFREMDEGLFAPRDQPPPRFVLPVPDDPAVLDALRSAEAHGMRTDTAADGRPVVAVVGALSEAAEAAIAAALPPADHGRLTAAARQYRMEIRQVLPPAERGERFVVPRLVADVQGSLELADADQFLEVIDWSLLDFPARLDAGDFDLTETADHFTIDLNGNRVTVQADDGGEQFALSLSAEGWSETDLVLWLEGRVRNQHIGQAELLRWLGDCVHHLVAGRRLPLAGLRRAKFLLERCVRGKLASFHATARANAYTRFLLAPDAKPSVSFDAAHAFEFRAGMYDGQRFYRGRQRFRRHFLGPDRVPAFSGVDDGEEEICAAVIDSIPDIEFWLRNVDRHPASFRLPTATDFFYPDFVARLTDGRTLVIEYKGKLTAGTDDTREKRTIGELWERVSGGTGLFLIVEPKLDGLDARGQITRKIGAG